VLHTYYQQKGGEDIVFESEKALLEQRGHDIVTITFHNQNLKKISSWQQALVTLWNGVVYRHLRVLIRERKPQVAHIHNTFPFVSPAVIHAAKAERIPVIMTLHNYRLLCVNALLFRQGQVCEDCLGHPPWRGVIRKCYRESYAASAVVASMLSFHHFLGTWDLVDCFIVLTEFSKQKFIQAGFPSEKLIVKPNFVYPDPGIGLGRGGYALFVGRLSPEKGVRTLLRAWEKLNGKVPLKIIGNGPLAKEVYLAAQRIPNVEWLGSKPLEEIYALMGKAEFLILPSEWYEGFPRVIIEAFAKGLPILTTALGSQSNLVEHCRTGLLFRPGDPEDLATKVEWILSHPDELVRMRKEARAEYETKYTAEHNYKLLMEIYQQVIENHHKEK